MEALLESTSNISGAVLDLAGPPDLLMTILTSQGIYREMDASE